MMKRFMSATAAFLLAIMMMVTSKGSLVWVSAETNTHTVTFNTQGVVEIQPQIVPHGGLVTRPTIPTPALVAEDGKLLYNEFTDWYVFSETGWISWSFNTPVTSDIEIRASYSPVEDGPFWSFIVSFDTDGAGIIQHQIFDIRDEDLKVKKPEDPVKEGFIFEGWYNKYWLSTTEYTFIPWNFNEDCTGVTFKPKRVENAYGYSIIEDGSYLYAQWQPDPYYTAPTTTTTTVTTKPAIVTTAKGIEHCYHCIPYLFDDKTMTVGGIYEGNLIENLIAYVKEYEITYNHYAVVLKNGVEVTSGLLEQGMKVRIYHDDILYGEYTVNVIMESNPDTTTVTTLTATQTITTTAKTTMTAKANSNAPKTGDTSRLGLYASIFGVSAIVMFAVGMKKKTNQ